MSETVDNKIRDEVMNNILAKPGNQTCFDCGSKAPNWSSPYLGIVICYECAAKHKSLELTGNSYTKERFNDLGVPLIGGNYDYNNSMVLKVRQEIAEKVKESLGPDEYRNKEEKPKKEEKIKFDNDDAKEDNKTNNKKEEDIKEEKKEEEDKKEEKQEEIQKPEKFEVKKKEKINNVKVKKKGGKINKIKKVDFDFDFDSFNDVNFNDFNKPNEEKEEEDEKKDDDTLKKEEKEKEREKESEDFGNSYDFKISKKEINKKFANKKAISSEDYAALENDDTNNKATSQRIKSMGNSQAISSEDVFGSEGGSNAYEGESMTDRLKEMALNFTLGAAEKAKELKNKTNEIINKVQNKFSGSGY